MDAKTIDALDMVKFTYHPLNWIQMQQLMPYYIRELLYKRLKNPSPGRVCKNLKYSTLLEYLNSVRTIMIAMKYFLPTKYNFCFTSECTVICCAMH